jgi:hypothetical protein
VTVAPSHAGMRDPLFFRDIEIDLIGNKRGIVNDDPCTFVKRINNSAGLRLATVSIKIEPPA